MDSSIPYLGIHLTSKPSLLGETNLPPLLRDIQNDLNRLARVNNSWLGRIVLYKMIILPKILYVLRALPIAIPNKVFSQFHSQMSKFIWQNRKPRLSLSTMNRRLQMGGLGLPNLKAYHAAVTLDQIRYWWHMSNSKQWVTLESVVANVPNWRAALLDPIRKIPQSRLISPPAIATLQYWKSLLSGEPPLSGMSQISIPIKFLSLYIPDLTVASWKERGITTIDRLFDGRRLRSFSDVQFRYNLPQTDFLKFAQIKHLLADLHSPQGAVPSRIMSFLQNSPNLRVKGSRIFYDLVTGNDQFTKSSSMIQWEGDLGKQFTEHQWSKAIYYAHHSSTCANHNEQYQKLLTRWYFTPLRLARACPTASPYC